MQRWFPMLVYTAVLICVAPPAESARAADEKPLSQRLFSYLDKNGDGSLDSAEMAKAPATIRQWLENNNLTAKALPRDTFLPLVPRMMADLRKPRPAKSGSGETNGGTKSGSLKPALYASSKPPEEVGTPKNPSERLPLDYRDADTNKDGQIDFAEWRDFRSGQIARFREFDKNGDSVLSPQELGAPPPTVASGQPPKKEEKPQSGSPVKFDELADEHKTKYRELVKTKYFDYLDVSKDGKLQEKEWDESARIKPIFVNAKIDITKDMPAEDFVNHYARLVGTEDDAWRKFARKNNIKAKSSGSKTDETASKKNTTEKPSGGSTEVTESTPYDKLPVAYREEYRKEVLTRYFDFLDMNKDKKLQEKEWDESARIKPIFVNAKIDITKDMSRSDFEKHYIKLVGTKDPTWQEHLADIRKKRR